MMQSVFIPFLLPGMNDIIKEAKKRKGNWSGYSDQKRKIQYQICHYLKDLRSVNGTVYIKFYWIEKSRRRDLDNIAAAKKFILDALVSEKVIHNDGWNYISGFSDTFFIGKDNPGVRVEIYEC